MSKITNTSKVQKFARAVTPFLLPSINVKSVAKEAFLRAFAIPA